MTVSQVHEALGTFSVKLKPNVPRDVLDKIEYFGHVAVIPGRFDARTYGDATLDSARYVGVLRKKKVADPTGTVNSNMLNMPENAGTNATLQGVSMNFWLGDEDDKGTVIEDEIQLTDVTFYEAITNLLPPSVTAGTIGGVTGSYSGLHQWQTPRKAIQYVCDTVSQPASPFNLLSTNNSSFEGTGGISGWTPSNAINYPAPKWVSRGLYAHGTESVTPGLPEGWVANDVFILIVEFDSTDNPTFSISGWTQIGTTQRVTAAVATKTGMAVFYRRATATEVAPVIPDTGDHTTAIIHAFRGCKTTGSPVNVSAATQVSTESTSAVFPTVTTTVANCTVLSIISHGLDVGVGQFSAWTDSAGTLVELTERDDASTVDGTGGGMALASSVKVSAGATGATPTVSLVNNSAKTMFSIALEPDITSASNDYSYLNTRSMKLTPVITGSVSATTNGAVNAAAVDQGDTYVAYFWVLPTGPSSLARVGITYKNAGYSTVSTATADSYLALPQNTWTQVSRTFTVPTGTGITMADMTLDMYTNSPATDRFYVDNIWLYESTVETPVSFRVTNRGTLDAGPESTLYVTNPSCVLVRQGSLQGEDMRIKAIPGTIGLDQDMEDFATRVVVLGESDGYQFSTGQATVGAVSPGTNIYRDIHGNPLNLTKMVSESQTTEENADTRAELALRKIITPHREIALNTSDYDLYGSFEVGDYVYIYDPDAGLIDTANEVVIRGVRINPLKLQVTESEWPVTDDYSVAYRAADGTWYDLTDYVEFDDDKATRVVIGNFQRTLDDGTQSVSSRVGSNAAPDNLTPGEVSWVLGNFQTMAYLDNTGLARAQQKLSWNTPVNEDGSAISDGAYYELQYRLNTSHLYSQTWGAVANLQWGELFTWGQPVEASSVDWETRVIQWGTNALVINDLAAGTAYDYRIRAIDNSNNQGVWSDVETVVAAQDDIPPSQPAAPTVAASLVAIQVTHNLGQISGGSFNLERDIAYVEVHAQYEPGFTPDATTLLGKMIANSSMLDAQTPIVGTFQIASTSAVYVKVIVVDMTGNRSSPSPASEVTAELIDDAHISDLTVSKITAGNITSDWILTASLKTGVEGQRIELNSQGLQAFDADGDLTTNISSNPGTDRDFISWRGTDGNVLASINSLGQGSFQDVSVVNSLTVQGTDILEELLKRPKGVVAFGSWSSNSYNISMATAGVEIGYMEISFVAEQDRMYKLTTFAEVEADTANSQLSWVIRYTTDGTRPNILSPGLNSELFFGGTFIGENITQHYAHFASFPPGPVRLLWCMSGNGAKQTILADAGPSQFIVEDAGDISLFDNVAVQNDGSGTGTETGDDITTVTKTYTATYSRSYTGDFDLRSELAVNDRCYQGYYSDTYLNQRSILGFNYSTIQADLDEATIKKVEVYLYAEHWYDDYGYAWIGTHNWLSAPGSWDGSRAVTRRYESSSWNKATGRWVDVGTTIGNELASGESTGLVIGPAPDFDSAYYGYFTGADGSANAPKIRITYTR